MKKKILTIAFLALFALPAKAGTIGDFSAGRLKTQNMP